MRIPVLAAEMSVADGVGQLRPHVLLVARFEDQDPLLRVGECERDAHPGWPGADDETIIGIAGEASPADEHAANLIPPVRRPEYVGPSFSSGTDAECTHVGPSFSSGIDGEYRSWPFQGFR